MQLRGIGINPQLPVGIVMVIAIQSFDRLVVPVLDDQAHAIAVQFRRGSIGYDPALIDDRHPLAKLIGLLPFEVQFLRRDAYHSPGPKEIPHHIMSQNLHRTARKP
jgi:hypothetical protein